VTVEKEIVILGTGGYAPVVADVCSSSGRTVAGFLGPEPGAAGPLHLGGDERLEDTAFLAAHEFLVAIGDQPLRAKLSRRILEIGGQLATAVHARAVVAPNVSFGPGTVVVAAAAVGPGSVIGGWAILDISATVAHGARLADGVHICAGATLAGDVTCGEGAFVGTGASVIRGIEIGAHAVVGAGAAVIRDVPADTTVAGVPAKRLGKSGSTR
jgi:sugar O-acyltransferase (sialic acid O-acetyltransferase NeuD family)